MSQQTRAALIQLSESLAITSTITALSAVVAYFSSGVAINWPTVLAIFAMMFGYSLAHGLAAYLKSSLNPQQAQLGQIIDTLITMIEQRYPGFKDTLPIPPPAQNKPTTTQN